MMRIFYSLVLMGCVALTAQAKGISTQPVKPVHPAPAPAPVPVKVAAQAPAAPAPAPKPAPAPTMAARSSTKASFSSVPVSMDPAKSVANAKPADKTPQVAATQVPTTTSGASPSRRVITPADPYYFGNATLPNLNLAHSSPVSNVDLAGPARLARLTAYWASEGDYYTSHGVSATGIHLHGGHCAVDPRIIPYGSVVEIAGVGKYLAVDTGSAVISREAAREAAHTGEERSALVIDLYFENEHDGEKFAANGPKYAAISWWSPSSNAARAKEARSLFADENWSVIQNKQL